MAKTSSAPETESNKARQAFEDYYALGAGRSLAKLAKAYQSQPKPSPPTKLLSTLKHWSSAFDWPGQVAARDAELAREQFEAMKKAARETGYALIEKRLTDLDKLADLLFEEINTEDKRWLPDVKQIGQGENAERVDIVRFNAPLIEQFRKTLDDIAAEMGQRVKGLELTGKDGGPIEVRDIEAIREQRWKQAAGAIEAAKDETEGT